MGQQKKVRKAVFPVAGLGTRFLPATKAVPKEMLTVVDKPIIQYVVDEALEAGIEHFVFVTGRNKHIIEDYFDIHFELEQTLRERSKKAEITLLADQLAKGRHGQLHASAGAAWPRPCRMVRPRNRRRRTLRAPAAGHDHEGRRQGLHEGHDRSLCPERRQHHRCRGMRPGPGAQIRHRRRGRSAIGDGFRITGMVEKPAKGTAPSNFFINGRYILQPEIFKILETQERGAGNEIQLTDGMLKLLQTQDFAGYHFRGTTYDCGAKDGFILANVAFALERADIRPTVEDGFKALLKGL